LVKLTTFFSQCTEWHFARRKENLSDRLSNEMRDDGISDAILNARWLRHRPQFPRCTARYDFRGTMRLYGRFPPPPESYPLVLPYVTPVLMACLEADISYHTINRSRGATLPFYFMQRARRDMCHYFRATIFLVTPTARATCRYSNVPPSRIIHVAFVFVKTLTKRCLPTWRPFNLHFAASRLG